MSQGSGINIEFDRRGNVDGMLQRLRASLQGNAKRRHLEAVGLAGSQLLREHFYGLQNQRGRQGGTGFYRQAGDLTFHRLAANGVYVGTAKAGMRQRLKGGTIRPRRASYLTIPIHPAAIGRRARDSSLPDLFPLVTSNPGVLILGAEGQGGMFVPYFLLVKEVTQNPDRSVLPTDDRIGQVTLRALQLSIRHNR